MLTVTATGRVTADLESRQSQKGNNYVRFYLAVNKGFGETAATVYLPCSLFGEQADRIVRAKVKKGSYLEIVGDFDLSKYKKDDKEILMPKVSVYSWAYIQQPNDKTASSKTDAALAVNAPTPNNYDETMLQGGDLPF